MLALAQRGLQALFPFGNTADHGFNDEEVTGIMRHIHARGDRIIGHFLLLHALLALGLALFYETWFVTLSITTAALAMFFLAARLLPQSFLARSIAGISLQTFVALHIYQMHGQAEQHFWFFTAFTMMIVYQDWRSMWPGALLIIAQHILFAWLHNSGVRLYFFEESFIGITKLSFHFGIALVQVGICGYWAHLLRQQTLSDAWKRAELQKTNALSAQQLQATLRSEAELQQKAAELLEVQKALEQDAARRRRAEEALRQLSQLQSAILDSANHSIISTTPDGTIRTFNAAAQLWLHYEPEDVIGKACLTLVHQPEELAARASQGVQNLSGPANPGFEVLATRAQHGLADEREWTYVRRDGSQFPVFLSMTVLQDAEDRITGFLAVASDISERKRAEAALRQSEEQNRALLRAIPDLMFVVRRDGSFVERKSGYDLAPHQFIGGSVQDLQLTAPEEEQVLHQVIEALNDRQLHCFEFKWTQAASMTYWEARVVALNSEEAFLIVRDITERKQSETALMESEERYRDLFENSSDLVQTLAPDGRLLFVNRAWLQTLGYDSGNIAGLSLWDVIHPECRERCAGYFERILRGENVVTFEATLRTKDGRPIQIEGNSSCRMVEGKVVFIRGIFRNVTEKKQLEAQMLRSQRLESIGRLAGGIAHDLNNVLAPITMSVQLLRRKLVTAPDLELLDSMAGSADRGASMIRQLLTFARGAEGERDAVNLGSIISDMARIVRETFPRQIDIRAGSGAELWTVQGDATQLHQVLMNLCVNARDAMPGGGVLEIAAENRLLDEPFVRTHVEARLGAYVVLTVADTGTGIPRDLFERIFEPFFTTKEVGSGTGLGLATVLGIVKSHGGFVLLDSEVGKGTQFQIYLPSTQAAASVLPHGKEPAVIPGNGEVILVVDDEPDVRRVTRAALVSHGYEVLTAANGAEAVALYAARPDAIHAVITDMSMPVMDGAATIRALQKLNPAVKLVAVSGLMEREKVAPLAQAGRIHFLNKPFSTPWLLATLQAALAGRPISSNTQFFHDKNPSY